MPFKFKDDNEAKGSEAIFPILKKADGKFEMVGTGFFICNVGVFVTAKHVLEDVLDENGVPQYPIGAVQFMPNDKYILRHVIRCCSNTKSDISVGILAPTHHNKTKESFINHVLTLTFKEPNIGENIATWAYPNTEIEKKGAKQILKFAPNFYEGKIEEILLDGRDKIMCPYPCYRSSINMLGGASGGPVVNEKGHVFAINCTGFDGVEDISYLARINEILPLSVDNVNIDRKQYKRISIKELIDMKQILIA